MALSIDHSTKVISIPQADLQLITGTLFELDTETVFRLPLIALLDDVDGIVLDDAIRHNTEVTVAGTTFARTIEVINGFSITFTPDAQYTVRLAGSNNNLFDVENGVLNQNQVQVIAQNSAGLIVSGGTDPLVNQVPGTYASGSAGDALGKIGSGQITTVSPVAQSGDVEIVRGDDYAAADARALDFTDTDAAWPDLTSATIVLTAGGFTAPGTVVTAVGANKKIRVELTDVQTLTLVQGAIRFTIRATLSNANEVVLIQGNMVVKAD